MEIELTNSKYLVDNPRSTIVPPIVQPPVDEKYRRTIHAVEKKLEEREGTVLADFFPLRHSFAEGTYIRELFIPKGYIVTGKIHPVSYVNFFLVGDVTMYTEEGVKRFQAPRVVISPAWTKRMSYSHTDMVWCTVHPNPTNSRDIEELESIIHVDSFEHTPEDVDDGEIYETLNSFIEHIKQVDKEELCQV